MAQGIGSSGQFSTTADAGPYWHGSESLRKFEDRARARNIVVSEKDGHLRTAVHFYNTEDDLTRFLDALQAA